MTRRVGHGGAGGAGQGRRVEQRGKALRLIAAIGGGDRLAQRRLIADGGGEGGKGMLVGHATRISDWRISFRLMNAPINAKVTY